MPPTCTTHAPSTIISLLPAPPPPHPLQRAKEAYVVPTLPWLRATYLHREQQQRFLHEVALAALHAAASAGRDGIAALVEADAAVRVTADAAAPHSHAGASAEETAQLLQQNV